MRMRGYQYIWLQLSASIITRNQSYGRGARGRGGGGSGHAEKVKAVISPAAEEAEGVRWHWPHTHAQSLDPLLMGCN